VVFLLLLEVLEQDFRGLAPLAADKRVVFFHDAFAYFADAFGLEVAGIIAMDGETSFSANQVSEIVELVKDKQIDMLFTLDDFKQPFFPLNFNATSLIFRITAMGQTFMFLGDADPTSIGILAAKYGAALKSDVVQVAHHGYYGGTKEGYDLIDAPIVLWPVPWYHPKNNSLRYADPQFSLVTREMIRDHAKAVYIQAKGTDILSLPLTGEEGTTLASPDDYPNKYWPEWKA